MKKPAVLFTSLAAAFAATLLATPARADDFPSAISVSGEATISAAPDLAQIDAGVANDAKSAKEASDANNAAMGKVLLALKGAGIAEKDYQTSRLSLQPQYGQNKSTGASPVVGFRASNRVTVKIRDVTKVAGIIDTLVGAGANDIGNISFEVTQASKLLDDARETGGRGRPPQGGDLRQGHRRHARLAAQRIRGRRSGAAVQGTNGDRADGGARGSRAGRGNAVGDGECELGDYSP